jgi:virulence factor Mce-like protein
MRRGLITALLGVLIIGGVIALVTTTGSSGTTYKIQLDNAFGLVTGAEFKVAGVKAGTIKSIDLDQKTLHAVVTVSLTQKGLPFHKDAFCLSRPQSLIGEYFISCDPGTTGPVLRNGATVPVTRTESTIPADLLQNITRLPERQRLTLIVGELGAAAAGRSGDLQAALARAVPALTETDNLLNILGNDSQTLEQLTSNANTVVTALANNSKNVQRFIVQANNAASDTATQEVNLQSSLQKLPPFLQQLRPALAKLDSAAVANEPVLANLDASSGELNTLFRNLPSFARASTPAIKALGEASVTGQAAAKAATPTVQALNQFAKPTPDLAQNLAIVTHVLDDRNYAVEPNANSPGGKGYTGLESLINFTYNLAGATNTYGPYGHMLAVDAFVSLMCSNYASPVTVETNLKLYGNAARSCYAWLGPNQPGVNQTDPSNPNACVPDPGGAPSGETGPSTTACKLGATTSATADVRHRQTSHTTTKTAAAATPTATSPPATAAPGTSAPASSSSSGSGAPPSAGGALGSIGSGISNLLGGLLGGGSGSGSSSGGLLGGHSGTSTSRGTTGSVSAATKALLNYLISP